MKVESNGGHEITPFMPEEASDSELHAFTDLTNEIIAEIEPTAARLEHDAYIAELRKSITHRGPRKCWVARFGDQIIGSAEVIFPELENDRYAQVTVRVTRRHRRAGVGSALLSACLEAAQAAGRDVVAGYNLKDGTAGLDWALALGFISVKRVSWQTLHIGKTDPVLWRSAADAQFRLERWVDTAPEELVDGFALARTAIEDAPIGQAGTLPPRWTGVRVREYEARLKKMGEEHWYVVAVCQRTGEVAGLTEIAFDPSLPGVCFQEDTAVLAEYRGLGLGRAMKAAMMRWLTAERPRIGEVRTVTAADNIHMIRVNQQLGYDTTAMLNSVEIGVNDLARVLGAPPAHGSE